MLSSIALILAMSDRVFLASYFIDNGQQGAFLAVSRDGYEFEPLLQPNRPILRPQLGRDRLMRDACIFLGPDQRWHMVWTTGWWDNGIGMAHSADLVNWGKQKFIPVMAAWKNCSNAWAPEITFDEKSGEYVIFWSSTIDDLYTETRRTDGDLGSHGEPLNHRYYYTTTKDFESYSPTKLLWDPGYNCIDATLLPMGDKWLMFGKDETKAPEPHKFIFSASAPSPTGPFAISRFKISGAYWVEGPTAVRLGNTVRVYFDRYVDDRWGAVESEDLENWRDVSERVKMPPHARHGTVVQVSRELVDKIRRSFS